ncbi:hypothetical protein V6N12_014018 [Hibiscus sabdariffa]|uniref:DUF4283 domain-containing protein n=1 Tax=Hibiscus sabdariffa TaxID=183260 RepID=A0ABR2CXP3_9ROSI
MDFDVWVPVHACSRDTFEQLVSYWGLVIVLEEATAKPSSFERGWVLVESSVLDRIEERLELLVDGHVFPIRLTESDTLLRGPRVYGSSDSRSSSDEVVGLEVMVPDEANATAVVSKDLLIVNSDEAEVEGVRWRGNELWNGQEEALNAIVQTGDSEQLVDVVGVCVGPGFEGSNADVKMSNNNSRKVRLLSDVISSLQTPEEKRKAIKKGRGRPRKAIVSNVKIADISLSDSNLRIELVFLVETKFEVVSEAVVKSPWWTDSFSFLMLAPEVLSRGILIIWELGNLDARDSFIDPNFILIRGVWCVENWDCAMIATYAPCEFMLQQDLW